MEFRDKSAVLTPEGEPIGCPHFESVLKNVGYHADRMNVYVVEKLVGTRRSGAACLTESENVIVVRGKRKKTKATVVHEFGHWFDLWHTDAETMPPVNPDNVMTDGGDDDMFTAGQCYRMNFSKDSYINEQGPRDGSTKNCAHEQDADGQCPGLKNEF